MLENSAPPEGPSESYLESSHVRGSWESQVQSAPRKQSQRMDHWVTSNVLPWSTIDNSSRDPHANQISAHLHDNRRRLAQVLEKAPTQLLARMHPFQFHLQLCVFYFLCISTFTLSSTLNLVKHASSLLWQGLQN